MPKLSKNYYLVLQVSPSAEQEAIHAAFERLSREYHPDVNPSSYAARRLQEIQEAYEVLGDSERRAQYDQERFSQAMAPAPVADVAEPQDLVEEEPLEEAELDQEPVNTVRWRQVLEEVSEEYKMEGPVWRRLGLLLAWAGGIAGAATLLVALLLLIVELFSSGSTLTLLSFSNWIFWASAILMFIGMLAPVASDLEGGRGKKDREARRVRRRIQRVYNPWRWRIWLAAALAFGLAMLVGSFT